MRGGGGGGGGREREVVSHPDPKLRNCTHHAKSGDVIYAAA